jgi:hypothetical protein
MVQGGSQKNKLGHLNFFIQYSFDSQMWLNRFMDGFHLSYITKLKKKSLSLSTNKSSIISIAK